MKKWNLLLTLAIALPLLSFSTVKGPKLLKKLERYCKVVVSEFDQIPEERKESLRELGDFIYQKRVKNEPVKLVVICTHNSRRSHIGQMWLNAAATWYGIDNVNSFSGGTEATALNPRAVAALNRAGFRIAKTSNAENPTYTGTYLRGAGQAALIMYSKKFSDNQNPSEDFAAIMVCSEADQSCPLVPGAEARVSLPFEDPRYYDETPSEKVEYDKTVRLIAREMFFAMSHAKEQLILHSEKER